MPVCNQCKKFSNCLSIDRCVHCGAIDWDERTVATFRQKPQPTAGDSPAPYFKPKEKQTKKWLDTFQAFLEKAVKVVILGGLAIVGLVLLVEWLTPEKDKLAEKYNIAKDKVIIEPKPHGCDFDDAPLGNKHCHYEEEITPIRECDTCSVTTVYVDWRKVVE